MANAPKRSSIIFGKSVWQAALPSIEQINMKLLFDVMMFLWLAQKENSNFGDPV